MQINLRKASAIQAEIRRIINSIKLDVITSVTEFTPSIDSAIKEAKTNFFNLVTRKEQLNETLFNIRTLVGRANTQAGINDLLTKIEYINSRIAIRELLANTPEAKTVDELTARVNKAKAANVSAEISTRAMYLNSNFGVVDTTVLNKFDIEAANDKLKELKRFKQDLQDALLKINIETNITLVEQDVNVLKEEGIL
jgi:putative protein kinase ArgK-like GTPase of G3E family